VKPRHGSGNAKIKQTLVFKPLHRDNQQKFIFVRKWNPTTMPQHQEEFFTIRKFSERLNIPESRINKKLGLR
jgi:hypothetical protein